MATDFLSEVDETQTAGFSSRALAETNFGLTEIDFLPLDEQASKNHERAIEIFNKLTDIDGNDSVKRILDEYRSAMESIDLRSAIPVLESIEGAENIVYVARLNLVKQVDSLLITASEVLETNSSVRIDLYGRTREMSLERIQNELWLIATDTAGIKKDIEEWNDPDNEERKSVKWMQNEVMNRLQKYLFDSNKSEREIGKSQNLMIVGESGGVKLEQELKDRKVTSEEAQLIIDLPSDLTRERVEKRIEEIVGIDRYEDNMFFRDGQIPEKVVVNISPQDLELADEQILALDWMYLDKMRLPEEKQPKVIVYTNGQELSGRVKEYLKGFHFCKTTDDLADTLKLVNGITSNQKVEAERSKTVLEEGQRRAYNNSELREWENVTASTYESLKRLIGRIFSRNEHFKTRYSSLFGGSKWFLGNRYDIAPTREIKTVLDLGTGEGRIAQMLARIGLNVIGVDLSGEQLKKAKVRITDEGKILRKESDRVGSSGEALLKLKNENDKIKIDYSDKKTRKRFLTTEGSFFDVKKIFDNVLETWGERFPGVNKESFFNEEEPSFDMAMFNWHTFCEVGSMEKQRDVLEQILSVLTPGGELVLEIPDRLFEPYASALKAYHEEYPDEPYGIIRDKKPDDFDVDNPDRYFPPRYFPDVNELVLLLKSIGFEVDIENDIQTYLVKRTGPDGKEEMTLKEIFLTARKPKK